MADPKFTPTDTPIANYNAGAIQWAYCALKFDTPKGPSVANYDPYYMYKVSVNIGGQEVDHVWFVNVDEHIKIQLTGAVRGTVLAAVYVKDGKRKGLVVAYSTGPKQPRDEAALRQQVGTAVAALQPANAEGMGMVLPPEQPSFAPPAADPAAAAPAAPPDPFATYSPTPPPPAQTAPPPPVQQAVPTAQHVPVPPKPPTPPAPAKAKPTPPVKAYTNGREYMPLSKDDTEVFKAVWRDTAKLHLWAYHELVVINTEMELPKITPANVRELATSVTIESWRQLGKGRSPVTGLSLGTLPTTAETRKGALELIGALTLNLYEKSDDLIRQWLKWVAEPVDSIGAWQHAGNICDLFGLDKVALIDDFNVDVLLQMTQAVWFYSDKRTTEDMSRNDVLFLVSHEYDIPEESMKFEEDEPTS